MNLVDPNGLLLFRSPAVQSALPLAGWRGSDVVRLLGAFSLFMEVDREGESEKVVCCGG